MFVLWCERGDEDVRWGRRVRGEGMGGGGGRGRGRVFGEGGVVYIFSVCGREERVERGRRGEGEGRVWRLRF